MDELALELAREARHLGLDALQRPETDPEGLQAFGQLVLTELAARGLLPGDDEIGCYAAPRSGRH